MSEATYDVQESDLYHTVIPALFLADVVSEYLLTMSGHSVTEVSWKTTVGPLPFIVVWALGLVDAIVHIVA